MNYRNTGRASRYCHMLIAVYQAIYIYTPLHHWQYGLAVVQYITFPLLVLTGIMMGVCKWRAKGAVVYSIHNREAPGQA